MEPRVLAVPTTEDPTSPVNARGRLSAEYLEKALDVVGETLKNKKEPTLRWKAAQWVMEMTMGKPKQEIDTASSTEKEVAKALGAALSHWMAERALLPAMDDGIYTLGEVEALQVIDITPEPPMPSCGEESSLILLDEVATLPPEFVARVPAKVGRQWTALPE